MTEKAQWDEVDVYDETTPFVYIFVRKDIPRIHQLIQAAHAAHNAGIKFGRDVEYERAERLKENPNELSVFQHEQASFCIFGVKNEQELESVAWKLVKSQHEFEIFYEPDFDMGYTAIATNPCIGEEERKMFKKYSLLI